MTRVATEHQFASNFTIFGYVYQTSLCFNVVTCGLGNVLTVCIEREEKEHKAIEAGNKQMKSQPLNVVQTLRSFKAL